MKVQISVEGDAVSVAHLHSWLRRDPDTRRMPVTVESRASSDGDMSTFDVLHVILVDGIAMTNLAIGIAAWRDARKSALPGRAVRLEHGGTAVSLSGASAEEIERVLRALRDGQGEGQGPAGNPE